MLPNCFLVAQSQVPKTVANGGTVKASHEPSEEENLDIYFSEFKENTGLSVRLALHYFSVKGVRDVFLNHHFLKSENKTFLQIVGHAL